MTSWVYVFAKFTPEALLFEALLISILVASYAAFWVLHKRKFGALHSGVPTGVVKDYLNELIVDAERMRAQLFGILAGRDLPVSAMNPGTDYAHTAASLNVSDDPAMAKKLLLLEAKMAEQSMAMDRLLAQKTEMEVALAAAKSAAPATGSAAAPVNTAATAELENKIKNLESKLAEYSVIEDDLANLKRLQQENAQLRAQLNGKGTISPTAEPSITSSPAPAPASRPAPVVETAPAQAAAPAAPAPEAEPASEPDLTPLPLDATEDPSSIDALFSGAAGLAASEPKKDAPADSIFEGLVDQVEKSLEKTPAQAPEAAQAPAKPAPAPEPAAASAKPTSPASPAAPIEQPSTSKTPAANMERSDADLVAEFEKMLNG